MAAVTLLASLFNTTNTSAKTTAGATPAVGDLIVIVTAHSANLSSTPPTDNNSDGLGTYTLLETTVKKSSADGLQIWARNSAIGSATSTTFTHQPAGTTTGGGLVVLKVTGMSRFGIAARLRSGFQADRAGSTTPAVALGAAALTGNALIGAVFNSTNSSTTAIPPSGWTERFDAGYSTTTNGLEVCSRDSGETGSTITWGGTTASDNGSVAVELDTSAAPASVSTLTDTFGDNSLAAQWTTGNYDLIQSSGTTSVGFTLAEANQRIEVVIPSDAGSQGALDVASANYLDLTNSSIAVNYSASGALSLDHYAEFGFGTANKWSTQVASLVQSRGYYWQVGPTAIDAIKNTGTAASLFTATHSSTTHRWLRIRHVTSGDTINFDTATSSAADPPTSGEWTNRYSGAHTQIGLHNRVYFGGYNEAGGSGTETVYFDGFNSATTSGGADFPLTAASGSFALTGTATAFNKGFKLTAATTSFALGGTAAALKKGFLLTAAPTSFALTGTAATFNKGFKLTAATTAFTLTGTGVTNPVTRKLVAAASAFTLTGSAANITKGFTMSAATTAFTLTGTAATPKAGRKIVAATTAFSLSGTASSLEKGFYLSAASGSFALTGTASSLEKGFLLTAATTAFALTGTAATLTKSGVTNFTLTAASGAFALTGTASSLEKGFLLTAATTAFTLSGTATGTTVQRKLTAASGAFALSGTAASLSKGFKLTAASGSFALSGTAASLEKGFVLSAASGAFTLTGTAATLTYSGAAANHYTLVAGGSTGAGFPLLLMSSAVGSAAFAINGTAATLTTSSGDYTLTAASGSFALTGTAAAFVYSGSGSTYTLVAGASGGFPLIFGGGRTVPAFTLTGTAAALTVDTSGPSTYTLVTGATGGFPLIFGGSRTHPAFTLTGTATGLTAQRKLTAATTAFTLTGTAATLTKAGPGSYTLTAATTSFALSGTAAGLQKGFKLTAASGSFAVTGTAATLTAARKLAAASAAFTLSGTAAGFNGNKVVTAASGAFALSGTAASLKAARVLVAGSGSFVLTPGDGIDVSPVFIPTTGVEATFELGTVLVWGDVITEHVPGWVTQNGDNPGSWGDISSTQASSWSEQAGDTPGAWVDIDSTEADNWVDVAS